jgi:hypothetical protein
VMDTPVYQRSQPATMANPVAAAASEAAPPPAAVSGSSHRGLYIALGAFVVVAVLFAAGLYLPSRIKTLAGAGKAARPQQSSSSATSAASSDGTTATPATPSSTDPAAPTASEAATAAASSQAAQSGQSSPDSPGTSAASSSSDNAATPSAGGTPAASAKKPAKPKKDQAAEDAAAQAKAEEAALADEVEKHYDDVDSRSTAVSQSLDNLQRQQAASGYGLRGDIVSARQRMMTDLSKAQAAMQKQDNKGAKKYLDMAEAELQTLEKFLGK